MKYHPHGSVLFVTFSIEQGLLLLNNDLGRLIVRSCLARAQTLHPVRISHLLIESNHVHSMIVVDNPEDVPAFVKCFKTESAHYINRLLGRRKRTIWCEGYDSPVVLTFVRSLIAGSYLYGNAAKDDLTESIDDYPGFSTWRMFTKGKYTISCKRLNRNLFTYLPRDCHNLRGYTKRAEEISAESTMEETFTIEPNAWIEAFGITDTTEQKSINARLIERVRHIESRAATVRNRCRKKVLGTERLINQTFDLSYLSNRSGKRMWCLSESRTSRMEFIQFIKDLIAYARSIRARWRRGEISIPYPPGLHPPSVPRLANALALV